MNDGKLADDDRNEEQLKQESKEVIPVWMAERMKQRELAESAAVTEKEPLHKALGGQAAMLERQFANAKKRRKVKRSLRPLHDRIVVETIADADFWDDEGLLVRPEDFKEKPQVGRVVAHGAGRHLPNGTFVKMTVALGDVIMFGKYAGAEIELNGNSYLVMREEEILGIVDEEPISEATASEEPQPAAAIPATQGE